MGILYQLVHLTHLQTSIVETTVHDADSFEKLLQHVEELMSFHINRTITASSRNDFASKAGSIACSIYCNIVFRNAEPNDTKLEILKSRLIAIITNLDNIGIQKHRLKPEALFLVWVLFTAGILCVNEEEQVFFIEHITVLLQHLQIKTWEQVDCVLRGYLWTDKMYPQLCLKFWNQVETALSLYT